MDLNQKIILITGASSGIGEALAKQLAARGAHLILCSRNLDALKNLREGLPSCELHQVLALDLSSPEQALDLIQKQLVNVGSIDILINNAGVSQRCYAEETPLAVDRQLMDVNYFGAIAMTKAVLPGMLARGHGVVVSISSVAGKVGSQLRSGYSASKHALIGFMDSLRAEVSKKGVSVIVVCPGWVDTNLSVNALTKDRAQQNLMGTTNKKTISAEQCAKEIIRALDQNRPEVIVGKGVSRWAPTIKRFFPGFFRWLIGRKVYR